MHKVNFSLVGKESGLFRCLFLIGSIAKQDIAGLNSGMNVRACYIYLSDYGEKVFKVNNANQPRVYESAAFAWF